MTKEDKYIIAFPIAFSVILAVVMYVYFVVILGGGDWGLIAAAFLWGVLSILIPPVVSFFVLEKKWLLALKTLLVSLGSVFVVQKIFFMLDFFFYLL